MTTTSNLPESMAMYEDVSHMMTMDTEEYDDYGGHYTDQDYDDSALPGQDSTLTGSRAWHSNFREGEEISRVEEWCVMRTQQFKRLIV